MPVCSTSATTVHECTMAPLSGQPKPERKTKAKRALDALQTCPRLIPNETHATKHGGSLQNSRDSPELSKSSLGEVLGLARVVRRHPREVRRLAQRSRKDTADAQACTGKQDGSETYICARQSMRHWQLRGWQTQHAAKRSQLIVQIQ